MALELIDTQTTDSNGEASITYTGTGAGEIEFRAKVSTLLQETYEIIDGIFYDTGVDGTKNTKWVNQNNRATITVGSTGTTITEGTTQNNITPSSVANSSSWNDRLTFNQNIVVEFDLVNIGGSMNGRVIHDNTQHQIIFSTTGHYKFVCDTSEGISLFIDGVEQTKLYTGTLSDITFAFATILVDSGVASITFKNFIIYPI